MRVEGITFPSFAFAGFLSGAVFIMGSTAALSAVFSEAAEANPARMLAWGSVLGTVIATRFGDYDSTRWGQMIAGGAGMLAAISAGAFTV